MTDRVVVFTAVASAWLAGVGVAMVLLVAKHLL